MWNIRNVTPWARKLATRGLLLAATTTLLVPSALVRTANAQVVISLTPPVCSYGYYEYSPYGCAPMGFYGPGYFYNGIFLGVGPWANWGYGHGWGDHHFSGAGGGRYVAGRGNGGGRAYAANRGRGPSAVRSGRSSAGVHPAAARSGAPHGTSHAANAWWRLTWRVPCRSSAWWRLAWHVPCRSSPWWCVSWWRRTPLACGERLAHDPVSRTGTP